MESIFSFLGNYLGEAFALFLGGLIKWLFDRYNPKEKAEITTTEISNGSEVIKIYKDALDDLPPRYEKRFKEFDDHWQQKVTLLTDKLTNIEILSTEKERIMKEEISFIKKERDLWKKRYNDLYKDYQKLQKEKA
jgi:hypothetical protein